MVDYFRICTRNSSKELFITHFTGNFKFSSVVLYYIFIIEACIIYMYINTIHIYVFKRS
jgi:hypothetical protein